MPINFGKNTISIKILRLVNQKLSFKTYDLLMKIEGVSSSIAAQNRKAEKVAAPGFVVAQQAAAKTESAHTPVPTSSLASLGSLLAVQQEDTPLERKRRAIYRADSLLDQLDDIRIATLEGRIGYNQISKLSESLKERLDPVDDDELQAILNDIELRAEVELAKFESNY